MADQPIDTTDQQAVTVAQLQKLQDWLREPDHAEHFGTQQILEWINRRPTHIVPAALARLASVSSASADWTRTKAFDEAAAECMRAAEASTFADTVSEDERNGHRAACNLLAMNFRVMASRAAPEWSSRPALATQPATSQEGEKQVFDGWTRDEYSAMAAAEQLAATPTPPTLSEDLREALKEMVYETTHLSPCKPNGDHDCTIKAATLANARTALARAQEQTA